MTAQEKKKTSLR